jgi:molecular chaperone GrpE
MQDNIKKEETILNEEINQVVDSENPMDEVSESSEIKSNENFIKDENLMKIEQLEKELNETKEQLLRLAADFDNYKKRTIKEKADIITYANEDLIKGILPILDDFERTMKVVQTSDNIEAIKQGLELVTKNLFHHLHKKGVEPIPALNEEFDSELHEAIGSLPADDEKKNKIIDVIEQGYKFQGKVIRHSKVIIGS